MAFEQQAAEPEFSNNHPALFTVYVTEIILYNLQQKETLFLIFPFVISLEFYENFFLNPSAEDHVNFVFIFQIITFLLQLQRLAYLFIGFFQ